MIPLPLCIALLALLAATAAARLVLRKVRGRAPAAIVDAAIREAEPQARARGIEIAASVSDEAPLVLADVGLVESMVVYSIRMAIAKGREGDLVIVEARPEGDRGVRFRAKLAGCEVEVAPAVHASAA